jgi:Putative restriction endonuclease
MTFFVDEQGALTTTISEPESDIFVIRGEIEDYLKRHAGPQEVPLVVEVADASVRRDRNLKKRVYARAGIACYWVINLIDDCIEVSTQPSGDVEKPTYAQTAIYRPGNEVPVIIDGKELWRIIVADVLGTTE